MTCIARYHGTTSAYQIGCRCESAREAKRLYEKRRLAGRNVPQLVDSTGSRRRVQALVAIGWPQRTIAAMLDKTQRDLCQSIRRPTVHRKTAALIAGVYDRLSDRPGPSQVSVKRAAAKGWLPPAWWDDDTIDDPTCVPVTKDSDRKAARREDEAFLLSVGYSDEQVAARLGVSVEALKRARLRDRQAGLRVAS